MLQMPYVEVASQSTAICGHLAKFSSLNYSKNYSFLLIIEHVVLQIYLVILNKADNVLQSINKDGTASYSWSDRSRQQ